MIFQPDLIVPILRHEKTETRRLRRPAQPECRYKAGRSYAVQPGRGQHAIATIRILDIHRNPLGHLNPAQARAEGFPTPDAFERHWERLHGAYDPDQPVWVIRFQLEAGEPPTRWLALELGYTTDPAQALPDEPPAIDADSQEWLTYHAHRREQQRTDERRREQQRHTLEQRLQRARALAATASKANGYDGSKHLRVIERRISQLEHELDQVTA